MHAVVCCWVVLQVLALCNTVNTWLPNLQMASNVCLQPVALHQLLLSSPTNSAASTGSLRTAGAAATASCSWSASSVSSPCWSTQNITRYGIMLTAAQEATQVRDPGAGGGGGGLTFRPCSFFLFFPGVRMPKLTPSSCPALMREGCTPCLLSSNDTMCSQRKFSPRLNDKMA